MSEKRMFKRYFESNSCRSACPSIHVALRDAAHRLYVLWLIQGGHSRDFGLATAHVAAQFMMAYLIEGEPVIPLEEAPLPSRQGLPSSSEIERALNAQKSGGPRKRFYDDEGCISASNMLIDDFRVALAPFFMRWVADNWHPRDFDVALDAIAGEIAYDHECACSLGGLGGGQDELQFLAIGYPGRPGYPTA